MNDYLLYICAGFLIFQAARAIAVSRATARWNLIMAESGDASDNLDSDEEFVTIKTRWVVSNAHQKHWVPSTKEASDGRVYIKLTKFDRSLVMFALGKGMQGKRNANVEAFDRLLEARKAASVQAVQAATDDSENTGTKKRKVRAEDQSLLAASHVTIDVPEVRFQNQTMGGYGMRCLWGIDSSCLWVELCKSNLKYMKAIIYVLVKGKLAKLDFPRECQSHPAGRVNHLRRVNRPRRVNHAGFVDWGQCQQAHESVVMRVLQKASPRNEEGDLLLEARSGLKEKAAIVERQHSGFECHFVRSSCARYICLPGVRYS